MLILRRLSLEIRDKETPFDSDKLNEESLKEFSEISEKLIVDFKKPDCIFISPYAASRMSIESLVDLKVIIDPEIGKCQINKNVTLKQSTEDLYPVFDYDIDDFKSRIDHRFRRLVQIGSMNVIWVITHPDVMRHILTSQKVADIPIDISVKYVVSMSCTLSKAVRSMHVIQKKPVKEEMIYKEKAIIKTLKKKTGKPTCNRCKKKKCICEEMKASLDSACKRCGLIPCVCIHVNCYNCGQIQCICARTRSFF